MTTAELFQVYAHTYIFLGSGHLNLAGVDLAHNEKILAECDVCAQHLSKSVSRQWATSPTLLSRPLKLRRIGEFLTALINHQRRYYYEP